MNELHANTPLLVGVGTIHQDAPAGQGDDAIGLMTAAARGTGIDCGVPRILGRVERILVTQGSWAAPDAGRSIARAIGASKARSVFVQLGIPQQAPIDQALTAIASGEIDVALVVGGEAKGRDDRARRAGITLGPPDDPGTQPDEVQRPLAEFVAGPELAMGFVVPVQQYATIDNALRAAEGRTIAEQAAEIDELWSRFDAVAATNIHAAFAGSRTPEQLRTVTADNRMLAFPYNKWHATQWSVDQAGALLLCSERVADEFGIERERRVHPLVSLDSSHSVSLSRRVDLSGWPAMRVLGQAAATHLGQRLDELDLVELYSCFPAAVRVQQRELALRLDGTPTLTGGMPFAGGPLNNFVFQATTAMVHRLRAAPGDRGLVTSVSGLLTKPGLAVWSTEAGERPPLLADLASAAAAESPERSVVDGYNGSAVVAAYTVRVSTSGEPEVVTILDTPEGVRAVAVIPDPDVAVAAQTSEFIGTQVTVAGTQAAV